jgi:hypothetical protein
MLTRIAFPKSGALAWNAQLRVKVLQMAPHYVMKNGVLMREVHLKAHVGPARTISVPVVPLPFIETVLHYCHADVLSAHAGMTKTIDKVRKHAYWQGWKRDATEYVRACSVCGSGKGYRLWKNGLMQRMPVEELTGPFSLLVVDAIGPLVTTPRGNKYILMFADYFTRWVEAFPVENLDTLTFVNLMVDEVIARHSVPERLLSDRGSNFISALAKSFYENLGIKKLFGATTRRPKGSWSGSMGRFWDVADVRQRDAGRLGFVLTASYLCVPDIVSRSYEGFPVLLPVR